MFCSGVYYYPGEPDLVRPCRGDQPYGIVQPDSVVRALCRSDLRAVVGHFSFGLHTLVYRPTTYLTMVRHPLDRVASLFYHLKRWPRYGENEPWLERVGLSPLGADTSLHEFVRTYPLRELDNDQTRRVAGMDPEYGKCDRSLLDLAKANIEQIFSFVGVMERFEECVQAAADLFGWSVQPSDYRENENTERRPTSSIPRETREAILERNDLDLELYAFANEWLDEHRRVAQHRR
jgi:hypothetical protein